MKSNVMAAMASLAAMGLMETSQYALTSHGAERIAADLLRNTYIPKPQKNYKSPNPWDGVVSEKLTRQQKRYIDRTVSKTKVNV